MPNPPGCEGPYWRRRASDIGRYSWRAPDMPCHDASWLRTSERWSGPRADSHFSASPFGRESSSHSALSGASFGDAFPLPSWLTGPTIAWPPSLTLTFPTTTGWPIFPQGRFRASICVVNVRNNFVARFMFLSFASIVWLGPDARVRHSYWGQPYLLFSLLLLFLPCFLFPLVFQTGDICRENIFTLSDPFSARQTPAIGERGFARGQ